MIKIRNVENLTLGKPDTGALNGNVSIGIEAAATTDYELAISRINEEPKYQLLINNEGATTAGNHGGIVFTQGVSAETIMASIKVDYAATDGYPNLVFGTRSTSAALTILDDGKVGIGTGANTLSHQFEIWHGTPAINLKDTSSSGQFRFQLDGVKATIKNHSTNGDLEFLTTGTGNIVLSPAGKVGIGTGSTAINQKLVIQGPDDNTHVAIKLLSTSSTSQGIFAVEGSVAGNLIVDSIARAAIVSSTASGTALQLGTAGAARVTIDHLGKVGIGTGSGAISSKLHVGTRASNTSDISIGDDDDNRAILTYTAGTTDAFTIGTRQSVTVNSTTTTTNYFDTLTIKDGNVGIGTGSDAPVNKLQIVGGTSITDGGTASPVGSDGLHLMFDTATSTSWIKSEKNDTSNRGLQFGASQYVFNYGKVGIGSTDPNGYKLKISNHDEFSTTVAALAAKNLLLRLDSTITDAEAGTDQTQQWDFKVDWDKHLHIDSASSTGGIIFNAGSWGYEFNGGLDVNSDTVKLYNSANTNNTYFFVENSGVGNAGVKMKNSQGEWTVIANDRLRFISDDDTPDLEVMSLHPGGGVGIGTGSTALVAKLTVEGIADTLGDSRRVVQIDDDTAMDAGVGGGIAFGGKYKTDGTITRLAGIWSEKETVTSGDEGGQLHLGTRVDNGNISSDLIIGSNGNVGIGTGTNEPSAPLQIYRANPGGGARLLDVSTDEGHIFSVVNGHDDHDDCYLRSEGVMYLGTNADIDAVQINAGNVGIGTGTGTINEKLEVEGGHILIYNTSTTTSGTSELKFYAGYTSTATPPAPIDNSAKLIYKKALGIDQFEFNLGGATDPQVVFTNSGNVGIGTGSGGPDEKLHVVGRIKVTGDSIINAEVLNNSNNSANIIYRDTTNSQTLIGNGNYIYHTDAGKVGIGRNPASHLTVATDGTNDTPAEIGLWSTDTSIVDNDRIARISAQGSDSGGVAPYQGAKIEFSADADWDTSTNYYWPTRIDFFTQDASGVDRSTTPRLTIDKDGKVGVGTGSSVDTILHVEAADPVLKVEATGTNSHSILNLHANGTGSGKIQRSGTDQITITNGNIVKINNADLQLGDGTILPEIGESNRFHHLPIVEDDTGMVRRAHTAVQVVISAGGGPATTRATASAIISNGKIYEVKIIKGGAGYSAVSGEEPTVEFKGGRDTDANGGITATATISNSQIVGGKVTEMTITNSGNRYFGVGIVKPEETLEIADIIETRQAKWDQTTVIRIDVDTDSGTAGLQGLPYGVGYTDAPDIQIGNPWASGVSYSVTSPKTQVYGSNNVLYEITAGSGTASTQPTHRKGDVTGDVVAHNGISYKAVGERARANATVSGGAVERLVIVDAGSGYNAAPDVTVVAGSYGCTTCLASSHLTAVLGASKISGFNMIPESLVDANDEITIGSGSKVPQLRISTKGLIVGFAEKDNLGGGTAGSGGGGAIDEIVLTLHDNLYVNAQKNNQSLTLTDPNSTLDLFSDTSIFASKIVDSARAKAVIDSSPTGGANGYKAHDAQAVVHAGTNEKIERIDVLNVGQGYQSAPNVVISEPTKRPLVWSSTKTYNEGQWVFRPTASTTDPADYGYAYYCKLGPIQGGGNPESNTTNWQVRYELGSTTVPDLIKIGAGEQAEATATLGTGANADKVASITIDANKEGDGYYPDDQIALLGDTKEILDMTGTPIANMASALRSDIYPGTHYRAEDIISKADNNQTPGFTLTNNTLSLKVADDSDSVDLTTIARTIKATNGSTVNTLDAGETLDITAGSDISITEVGGVLTITNDAPDVNHNSWRPVTAGGNTLATTETLAFATGTGISIAESNGTVTITNSAPDVNHNSWRPVTAGGNTLATTETLAFATGTGISIAESNGTVTITNSAPDVNHNVSTNLSIERGGTCSIPEHLTRTACEGATGGVWTPNFKVVSSDGNDASLPLADTDKWGLMSDIMFDKLGGIAAGATNTADNVSTNLSVSRGGTCSKSQYTTKATCETNSGVWTPDFKVVSSDGDDASLPLADANRWGLMSDKMFDDLYDHNHDDRYYTETEIDTSLTAIGVTTTANATAITANATAITTNATAITTNATAIGTKHPTIDANNRLSATLVGANGNVSDAEYGHLAGVTSDIQTQITANATAASTNATAITGKQAALTSTSDISINKVHAAFTYDPELLENLMDPGPFNQSHASMLAYTIAPYGTLDEPSRPNNSGNWSTWKTVAGSSLGLPNYIAWDSAFIVNLSTITPATQISDERAKLNIRPLHFGLDFINKINPVTYHRDDAKTPRNSYGVLAQEIVELLEQEGEGLDHEAIVYNRQYKTNPDAPLAVAYSDFVPILIKSVQELTAKIETLENRIEELEK